jgi:DNA-binding CsgD family transcriptional regulator
MKNVSEEPNQAAVLVDLLPVGTMLSHQRVITSGNSLFAGMFGYASEDLEGASLAKLYPSYREFVDRGDQWLAFMRDIGEHCDERIMLRKGEHPVRMRVRGRCKDRRDPYKLVACTFEIVSLASEGAIALTRRERSIVELMGDGLTSKEIAKKLDLSHRTIETYRARLMAKTGARNASQLLALTL